MKKLVFLFCALSALTMFSCIKGQQSDENNEMQNDSTTTAVDSTMQVTGVAVDGAMNSISLVVDGDTVDFSYPDLDNDHRASWDIDDTVTVRYVVTQYGDSVTDVINNTDA